jgi:hypothetical protein
MRKHTPEELQRFFAPFVESSSTWARYRPNPDAEGVPVHMPPGEGAQFRDDTTAGRYRCVLPSCDGLFWVSAGEKNAHHWRHRTTPSVEHSPETMWHIAAKTVLVEFARAQQPTAEIQHDDKFTPSKNKPDVWVKWPATGDDPAGNIAFEAQHSAIGTTGLKLRNARYEIDGIVPVWLFSHLAAPVIGPGLEDGAQLRLHEAHKSTTKTAPLRWFNPDERTVATAYVRKAIRPDVHRGEVWHDDKLPLITYTRAAASGDDTVRIGIDPLDACTLDSTGLHTPTDRWIADEAARAAEEEADAYADYQRRFARLLRAPEPRSDPARDAIADSESAPRRIVLQPQEPRPPYEPLAGPCPYCGGARVARTEWPHWYRPPTTTVAVAVCSVCELVLGAIPAPSSTT